MNTCSGGCEWEVDVFPRVPAAVSPAVAALSVHLYACFHPICSPLLHWRAVTKPEDKNLHLTSQTSGSIQWIKYFMTWENIQESSTNDISLWKKRCFTFSKSSSCIQKIFRSECQVMLHLYSKHFTSWSFTKPSSYHKNTQCSINDQSTWPVRRTHRCDSLALIMCDEMLRAGGCVWKACDVGGVEDESRWTLRKTQWLKSVSKHQHNKISSIYCTRTWYTRVWKCQANAEIYYYYYILFLLVHQDMLVPLWKKHSVVV